MDVFIDHTAFLAFTVESSISHWKIEPLREQSESIALLLCEC